jgi:tetratricopeptide (TPR) repeat protein
MTSSRKTPDRKHVPADRARVRFHILYRLAPILILVSLLIMGLGRSAAPTAEELYREAERLIGEGRTEEAAARLKEAVALDPNHWMGLCRLGEIQAAAKQYAPAEQSLKDAVTLHPANGACQSRLAQVLLLVNKVQEAERALEMAAALLPDDEGVLYNLARVYEVTGRIDRAIETYARHLAVAPNNPRAEGEHLKLARMMAGSAQSAGAIDHYRAFLSLQPGRNDVRAEMAAGLMSASRFEEALPEFDRVIASGSVDAAALANAGSIHLLRGDLQIALDLLDRAVKADPNPIPPRLARATALAQMGDHAAAVEVLQGVTAGDPVNNRAWFLLGQSLMKLGRVEEARAALERHRAIHEKIMRERMSAEPQGHP